MTPGTAVAAATIELVVLDHDIDRVGALVDCGVGTFLVDWECARQGRAAARLRHGNPARNRGGSRGRGGAARRRGVVPCEQSRAAHAPAKWRRAIAAGARGLFLPMVKSPADVERFLSLVGGRAATGILVETVEGLACVEHLASYPLDRVYFGLNDFAISRGSRSIFSALVDGSVARARDAFAGTCFGVGRLDGCRCGTARALPPPARGDGPAALRFQLPAPIVPPRSRHAVRAIHRRRDPVCLARLRRARRRGGRARSCQPLHDRP